MYVFSLIAPLDVVLGNWRFSPVEAVIYSGFWVTFFVWVLWDFALAKGVKFDTSAVTLGYFWSANIFAFWIVSRFSQYMGFGITNYVWALIIGLFAYIFQRVAFQMIVDKNKS